MHDDRPTVDFSVFGTSPLDTTSPIPLYHQIEGHLRQLIVSGKLPANTILPPELELGTWYGVGRHTMRTALTNLVNDRLISRRAGVGTYVLPQTQQVNFSLNRSFTHQITAMGMQPHSRVLSLQQTTLDANAPLILQAYVGVGAFVLVRLRSGDDTPISLQYTTIIGALGLQLMQYDFATQSLYTVLQREFGVHIDRITHTINAVVADETQAQLLDVTSGTPLLVVNTASYSQQQLIEYTISYYRTDKYAYHTVFEHQ
ncbi:MAG: GntR family transcriptional regulator [Roseiflexaceae bacterium]